MLTTFPAVQLAPTANPVGTQLTVSSTVPLPPPSAPPSAATPPSSAPPSAARPPSAAAPPSAGAPPSATGAGAPEPQPIAPHNPRRQTNRRIIEPIVRHSALFDVLEIARPVLVPQPRPRLLGELGEAPLDALEVL